VIGKSLAVLIVIAGISASASLPCRAEDDEVTAIAKALPEATISIAQGLKLSEPEGKPISAEYEIQSGMLLLSVYTIKENQFSEVLINAKSGSLEQVEPLTDADALKDAQDQSAAMAKAKVPLRYTRIDALPQLFNVLRGEMSIIDSDAYSPSFLN